MANPDDSDFDDFVEGAMNATFSSAILDDSVSSEFEDNILHNNGSDDELSDVSDDLTVQQHNTGRPTPPMQLPNSHRLAWTDVTNNDPGPTMTIPIFDINHGPVLPNGFDVNSKPIDFFELFFNDDILQLICMETNHFAGLKKSKAHSPHSRINKWSDMSVDELKAFLGTVINMGTMPLPRLESYFTNKWETRISFYKDVFSKNRFLNIFWNLHFNHVDGPGVARGKDFQIKPVIDHVRKMTTLFYTPSDKIAVDESTISFKGRVSFRVYNPQKPTKFGLKLFVVSDCYNGYIYDFMPYFGKQDIIPGSNLLKTTQIVKKLCTSVSLKNPLIPVTGIHVYTDRYYTSPELANELLAQNIYLTGTVMPTRKEMPPNLKQMTKKMKKGDIISQRQNDILVVSWKDKRVVHMLSTHGKGSKSHVTDVPNKWPNLPPVPKPDIIIDYTKHMGAVDRSDHFISSYEFMRRTKKWYRKMFFWLLEVCLVNSYLLYKEVQIANHSKPLSHLEFRKSLVGDLVANYMKAPQTTRRRGRPSQGQGPVEERLNGKPHFLSKREKGSARCVVCLKRGLRKETIYHCKTCGAKPALHPDLCFELYHTQAAY